MDNSCITNYAMIFMFIIIIFLVINQRKISNKENFALSSDDLSAVRNEINRIYDMDVEAIRNLGHISKSLLTGTNTFTASATGTPGELKIPADRTILQGAVRLENSTWDKAVAGHPNNASVGHIVSDNNFYKSLMIVGNNTAGGVRKVGIWDNLEVNGSSSVAGNLNVTGPITGQTINSLVATNTSLQNQINSLQNQINALTGRMGTAESNITANIIPPGFIIYGPSTHYPTATSAPAGWRNWGYTGTPGFWWFERIR